MATSPVGRTAGHMLLVAALMVAAAAIGVAQIGNTLMVEPDTSSYLHFSAIRGLGYPTFLFILRSVGVPLDGVPWVQLGLHLATLPVLFTVLRRATGALWLAAVIVLVTYANPEVAKYHAKILSESLFLTVLILFVAAFLSYLDAPKRRRLLLAAACAALAVTVKQAGWPFVVLLALVVAAQLVRHRGRAPLLGFLLLPVVLIVGAELVAARVIHGPNAPSLAPLHLFAKAGMIDAEIPDALLTDGPNAPLQRALQQDAAPIRRLIARAPTASIARFLSVNYEVFLQYRFALAERRAFASAAASKTALLETGLARLRYGWLGYLDLTLRNYLALWLLYDASHPAHADAVNAFITAERPLPFEEYVPALVETVTPAGLKAVIARPAIAAAGIATLLLAVVGLAGLVRPDRVPPLWRQAGLLALGLHGFCLLVALTGIGIPRYLLGIWPLLTCSLGLAAAAALPGFTGQTAQRRFAR